MKPTLRTLFSPILNYFEKGDEKYDYKKSHRTILIVVGFLFSLLATGVYIVGFSTGGLGFLLPALVFTAAGLTCLVVGFLGSDRAVAKIWNSRN